MRIACSSTNGYVDARHGNACQNRGQGCRKTQASGSPGTKGKYTSASPQVRTFASGVKADQAADQKGRATASGQRVYA